MVPKPPYERQTPTHGHRLALCRSLHRPSIRRLPSAGRGFQPPSALSAAATGLPAPLPTVSSVPGFRNTPIRQLANVESRDGSQPEHAVPAAVHVADPAAVASPWVQPEPGAGLSAVPEFRFEDEDVAQGIARALGDQHEPACARRASHYGEDVAHPSDTGP